MDTILINIQKFFALYGLNIVAALLIFIFGRWAGKLVCRILNHLMEKKNVDPTLRGFVSHLVYIAILAFVIIAYLGKLGIQTASFVAILGAAGLAIGLALQGSLSNFCIWRLINYLQAL